MERPLDYRIARFVSPDRLEHVYIDQSPYNFVGGCPTNATEVDGDYTVVKGNANYRKVILSYLQAMTDRRLAILTGGEVVYADDYAVLRAEHPGVFEDPEFVGDVNDFEGSPWASRYLTTLMTSSHPVYINNDYHPLKKKMGSKCLDCPHTVALDETNAENGVGTGSNIYFMVNGPRIAVRVSDGSAHFAPRWLILAHEAIHAVLNSFGKRLPNNSNALVNPDHLSQAGNSWSTISPSELQTRILENNIRVDLGLPTRMTPTEAVKMYGPTGQGGGGISPSAPLPPVGTDRPIEDTAALGPSGS